jgi:glucosyl-3-phosphoglycerate synthase
VDLSVVIPTRNEESTVAGVVAHCLGAGADEVLVVDSGSTDATRDAARDAGASVHDSSDLFAELGPVRGKGDALWRALPLSSGAVVAFVDGDLTVFDDLLPRLLAPLGDDGVQFSKANITRLDGDGHRRYGRVTQYTAKPLLAVLFPELADLDEPLSGQVAASRHVLMQLGFEPDYGLEIGMLIDVWRTFGRDAIAHPDCGRIIHAEQSDDDLGDMAAVVARAALARSGHAGADHVVRPPHLT